MFLIFQILIVSLFFSVQIHKNSNYQSRINFLVMEMNHLENHPHQIQVQVSQNSKCIKKSHNIWLTVSKKETMSLNKQELRSYVEAQLNSCSII